MTPSRKEKERIKRVFIHIKSGLAKARPGKEETKQ